jgi:hypothetical protein
MSSMQQYVALKVLRSNSTSGPLQPDEGKILRTVQQNNPAHPGHEHIVKLINNFVHAGPNGHHSCPVFEAVWISDRCVPVLEGKTERADVKSGSHRNRNRNVRPQKRLNSQRFRPVQWRKRNGPWLPRGETGTGT